jgi:serine phosphatase RsbU (regulator of sigma subunit)
VRDGVAPLERHIAARTLRAQRHDRVALDRLRVGLLVSWSLLALILLVGALLLRRWVLGPVNALRGRMRLVAAGRLDEQVLVDGPPEVAAIARDAENMRRRIVAELEATRGATEALSQHSPVVSALRGQLTAQPHRDTDGLDFVGAVRSAEGVLAGDWWEAVPRPDGSTAMILADVSGHGAEAGLVAFAFKHRITALLDSDLELGEAFTLASRWSDGDSERFVSCLVVVVDPAAGTLAWVNAGHPPGLVVGSEDRGRVTELVPTGPLICSVASGWTVGQVPFGPADLLVACTDGVLEARAADGAEFGTEGLLAVLRSLRTWSAQEAVSEIQEAVRRFGTDTRRDDVTCVALALAPAARRAAPA